MANPTYEQFKASHPKLKEAKAQAIYNERYGDGTPAPASIKNKPLKNVPKNIRKDVKGDIAVADIAAEKQIQYGNADTSGPFGSSQTTFNPETGKYEYTETLSEPNQQILQQGQQLTQQGQQMAMQGLQGYQPFQNNAGQVGYNPNSAQNFAKSLVGSNNGAFSTQQQDTPQHTFNPDYGNQGSMSAQVMPRNSQQGGYTPFTLQGSPEERARIEEEVFGRLTKNFDRDQQREMVAKEQELFNKGIPYSDDPESRYQKEIRGIQDRYAEAKADARGQAVMMGGNEHLNQFGMGQQSYTTNLTGQQQQYNQNLMTHQQGIADITGLQGLGSGLMYQPGPGFGGASYSLTPPSAINLAKQGLNIEQQAVNNDAAAKRASLSFAQQQAAAAANKPPEDTSGL